MKKAFIAFASVLGLTILSDINPAISGMVLLVAFFAVGGYAAYYFDKEEKKWNKGK